VETPWDNRYIDRQIASKRDEGPAPSERFENPIHGGEQHPFLMFQNLDDALLLMGFPRPRMPSPVPMELKPEKISNV
jgi:hypothetical protein